MKASNQNPVCKNSGINIPIWYYVLLSFGRMAI